MRLLRLSKVTDYSYLGLRNEVIEELTRKAKEYHCQSVPIFFTDYAKKCAQKHKRPLILVVKDMISAVYDSTFVLTPTPSGSDVLIELRDPSDIVRGLAESLKRRDAAQAKKGETAGSVDNLSSKEKSET